MIFLCAALCGGALVLSLAPFNFWPLAFLSAGGLYSLLTVKPEAVNRIALGFGLAKFGVGLSWVYVSIHVHGSASPVLAGGLVLLMVTFMSLSYLAQLRLFMALRTEREWLNWLLFTATWVMFEWFWTWFLTGFPWLFAGYSQLATPLAGLAPLGGVFLVSAAVVLIGVAGSSVLRSPRLAMPVIFLTVLVSWLAERVEWTTAGETYSAALVQGNTEQSVKWNKDQRDAIVRTHVQMSAPWWGKADVILWPEGAVTYWAHEAEALLTQLHRQGVRTQTALVTGIPLAERIDDDVYAYNGVIAVGAAQGQYRKQDLVPFGEYVPLEGLLRGLIAFFDLPMSGFSAGGSDQPQLQLKNLHAAMLICYEIAYPETVRAQSVGADVLLTISNDTWFGSSIGPLQHMQLAQMRARETGRWILRATNNGVTGIIDPKGRITTSLPQFQAAVLQGSFRAISGSTPFQHVGNWPVLLLSCLVLGLAFVTRQPAR
jgi:apolipoprotein N-acyltransferase